LSNNLNEESYEFLKNSILYDASLYNKDKVNQKLLAFVKSFQLNVFYDFILDFKHFETIIQRSFDVKNLKETTNIVNFLLQNINKWYFKIALKRDLPQLLTSQKFKIKNLVDITENLKN
jgi:hypothetical protein